MQTKEYKPASQETYKKGMQEILKTLKSKCKNSSSTHALSAIEKRIDEPFYPKA